MTNVRLRCPPRLHSTVSVLFIVFSCVKKKIVTIESDNVSLHLNVVNRSICEIRFILIDHSDLYVNVFSMTRNSNQINREN